MPFETEVISKHNGRHVTAFLVT